MCLTNFRLRRIWSIIQAFLALPSQKRKYGSKAKKDKIETSNFSWKCHLGARKSWEWLEKLKRKLVLQVFTQGMCHRRHMTTSTAKRRKSSSEFRLPNSSKDELTMPMLPDKWWFTYELTYRLCYVIQLIDIFSRNTLYFCKSNGVPSLE